VGSAFPARTRTQRRPRGQRARQGDRPGRRARSPTPPDGASTRSARRSTTGGSCAGRPGAGAPKDERARGQQRRVHARVVGEVRQALGHGDVSDALDKAAEFVIRDEVRVHPEAVHHDAMGWLLLRVEAIGSHQERAARNPHHALGRWQGTPRRFGRQSRSCSGQVSTSCRRCPMPRSRHCSRDTGTARP
jgi:hypothetical protein